MVKTREQIIKELKNQFSFVQEFDSIMGVLLYGSVAENSHYEGSDIDVCIVTPHQDLLQMYNLVMENIKGNIDDLDIRFFEELPLLVRGEIVENGIVLYTKDLGDLTEYFFYSTRLELEDYRFRLKYI